jgi:hypothetical protein
MFAGGPARYSDCDPQEFGVSQAVDFGKPGAEGRFLGCSDLDQIFFWTPFIVLRLFLKYRDRGGEILTVLTKITMDMGLCRTKRETVAENQRELALEGIRAVGKSSVTSCGNALGKGFFSEENDAKKESEIRAVPGRLENLFPGT